MAYTHELGVGAIVPNGTGVLVADVLTAAGVHGEYLILQRARIQRIYAAITTVVLSGTAAAVVTVWKRSAPGVTASQVSLGTLTIPTGSAVGKVIYKDITQVELASGDAIAFEVTTAATDAGTPTGGCIYGFWATYDPEDPRNESDMVLSV